MRFCNRTKRLLLAGCFCLFPAPPSPSAPLNRSRNFAPLLPQPSGAQPENLPLEKSNSNPQIIFPLILHPISAIG